MTVTECFARGTIHTKKKHIIWAGHSALINYFADIISVLVVCKEKRMSNGTANYLPNSTLLPLRNADGSDELCYCPVKTQD